jgi:DNA mismatch endonuclease (patch repair protein)
MPDVHSIAVRSYNMSKIRGKDTKPELLVRKFLFSKGFRYRLHVHKLPGKPDIVLSHFKTIIFIHGCFWHGHEGCRYFKIPSTRKEWWENKIARTKTLDSQNKTTLKNDGWKVIEIWECDLRPRTIDKTLEKILNKIK